MVRMSVRAIASDLDCLERRALVATGSALAGAGFGGGDVHLMQAQGRKGPGVVIGSDKESSGWEGRNIEHSSVKLANFSFRSPTDMGWHSRRIENRLSSWH
jgi:hypothetical protein